MTTLIKTYLNSLSEDILTLSIESRGIKVLPDLTRFKNLKQLYCSNNQLSSLPNNLPQGLEILYCSNNNLTSLPDLTRLKNLKQLYCTLNQLSTLPTTLPETLEILYCSHNELLSLPTILPQGLKELYCSNNLLSYLPNNLPQNLVILYCFDNKITSFPTLPEKILHFYYTNNPICSILDNDNNTLIKVKQNIKIVNNFRHLYYSLQFKKQLIKWLYKSQKLLIMDRYHLKYLLENLNENTDLDEFLNNW